MRILFAFMNAVICLFPVNGQATDKLKEMYEEGQYFLNREDYKEAAFYFRKIVDQFPDNANFNFKLGECYMNIPGSETLAVPCFEIAIKHIVPRKKYNRKDFEEKNAPLYAYFYLGNVYRISNRLDEAMKAYTVFINSPFYTGNYNETIVDNEIKSCERAKIIQDNPIRVLEQRLDTIINTTASELNPVVSQDENTLVFVRRLKFYDAILLARRQGNTWSQPVNLNPVIGSDGDLYPTCLSADGRELYLVKNGENKDIWVSSLTDAGWSKATRLNDHVNSTADESSACISSDGRALYFASDRKGGYGGRDIYVSQRDSRNEWGKARNLGPVINTPFDEDTPCLINHDTTLFFSSKGHFSMGGYDIFYSNRQGKTWREPVNLGFPINNTGDNLGFAAVQGGKSGYYSKIDPADPAEEADIFRVTIQ
jgi:hypothetical protein